ncbi:MAG: hypothetical protein ACP5N1_05635 [Candidatus Woesearchaeota archaeon]
MFEIDRYIGNGVSAAFFKIRGHSDIGIKIIFCTESQFVAKRLLQTELDKARILKKLGISMLNYQDIIKVKIHENIEKTLNKSSIDMATSKSSYGKMKEFFINNIGNSVWGLVMEYIPDDAVILKANNIHTLVSINRIEYLYNLERKKIEQLGIKLFDSFDFDNKNYNIIWSESRAKLYFIDFLGWDLSNVVEKKNPRRSLFSFIFGR